MNLNKKKWKKKEQKIERKKYKEKETHNGICNIVDSRLLSIFHIEYYKGFFLCRADAMCIFSVQFSHSTMYLSFHSFWIVVNSRINLPKYGYLNAKKRTKSGLEGDLSVQTEMKRKVNELLLYKCVYDSISFQNIFIVIGKMNALHPKEKKIFFFCCFMSKPIRHIA